MVILSVGHMLAGLSVYHMEEVVEETPAQLVVKESKEELIEAFDDLIVRNLTRETIDYNLRRRLIEDVVDATLRYIRQSSWNSDYTDLS